MSWDQAFTADAAERNRNPAAGMPATLSDVMSAEWDAAGLSTTFGVGKPYREAADELETTFERVSGRSLRDEALRRGPALETLSPRGRAGFVASLAAELPAEQQESLKPLLDVDAAARKRAQAIEARSAEIGARTYGLSGVALSFATGAARQAIDPLNLAATVATAPLGGTGGMAIGAFLGRELAVNAATQAIQEPFIQAGRAELGLEAGFGEAVKSVAMAGVGGAGIAGLLRGGGYALRRAVGREAGAVVPDAPPALRGVEPEGAAIRDLAPEDLDAAARLAERDHVMDAAAIEATPEGRIVSADAIQASTRALDEARPLPATQVDLAPPMATADIEALISPSVVRRKPPPAGDLSITQFIARHGGLSLEGGEAAARDLQKVFVPGGGMLARKTGKSIDGYWRELLIENGYLPRDADGGNARQIREELFDAIARDRAGDRVYTEDTARRRADNPTRAMEADRIARETDQAEIHLKSTWGDLYPDGIDGEILTEVASRMVRGEVTDELDALDRAFFARESRGMTSDEALAGGPASVYDDIPFDEPTHGQPSRTAPELRDPPGGGSGGDEGRGSRAGSSDESRNGPNAGSPARPEGERTPAGDQGLISGVAPIGDGERLRLAAERPIRGGDAPAGGLFDATARAQTDLVDQVAAARRADVIRALDELGGDFAVHLDDGTTIQARDLLARPERDAQAAAELTACILGKGAA